LEKYWATEAAKKAKPAKKSSLPKADEKAPVAAAASKPSGKA
jgi:hypothetical protein